MAGAENMVIGYLTSIYARAGDTFIRNEVLELRRRGHDVHTFSIRGPERSEIVSEIVRQEQESTTYILQKGVALLLLRFVLSWIRCPRSMLLAARLAWSTRPPGIRGLVWQLAYLVESSYLASEIRARRISHLHNHIGENSAAVAMLAARIAGITYSVTVHGPGEFYAPARIALREKIHNSAFTVCISNYGRSQCMIWTAPEHWSRIHIVRCGLDGTFLEFSSTSVPIQARFACVGRLCPEKGQLLLVEAVSRLREEGHSCEVTLVGDGPLRGDLEAFVQRYNLRGSVHLVGWKNSEEVRAEILRSRALVMPSFAEGLPVAIIEALALGRPVISTYVAGIPELVQDGINGWLIPAGSVDGLVDAMRDASEKPTNELELMGRRGTERVRTEHDLGTEVAKLEDLVSAYACRDCGRRRRAPENQKPA